MSNFSYTVQSDAIDERDWSCAAFDAQAASYDLTANGIKGGFDVSQSPTNNMFSKLTSVTLLALITLAAATGTPPPPPTTPDSPQCCESVVPASSNAASLVAAVLALDLTGITVPVGLSCTPITVGGSNCGDTTVVCNAPKEEWHGLIAINCIPITV
ncbi:Hydrophobin 2 [Mycena kentingensis (nom. inval.)]|nr:Hydrophobin 2 [Mycena kentingensis (nom. inval.)]